MMRWYLLHNYYLKKAVLYHSKKKSQNPKPHLKPYLRGTYISFFTSNKDRIPKLSNSGVIYQYSCPGCAKSYIGKTDNTLFNRTKQHGWSQKDSAIRKHFLECDGWKELVGLFEVEGDDIDTMQFQVNMVRENTKVIGKSKNWLTLAFRESLAIKQRKPELNKGLRSCKELSLF